MAKTKLKHRVTNPLFIKFFALALFTPALTSLGINFQDIQDWNTFLKVITVIVMNPFLLGSTVFGVWIFFKDGDPREEESK